MVLARGSRSEGTSIWLASQIRLRSRCMTGNDTWHRVQQHDTSAPVCVLLLVVGVIAQSANSAPDICTPIGAKLEVEEFTH